MQFLKLRLSGFKSFVDPIELIIAPGITGVVGPNGCGKSNLVEALRWAMGESSAKRMRGSEMDDVIFCGTADRPARNLAEVGIFLDNRGRTAPPPFEQADELEVVRRIERQGGSDYRINGRHMRARDVHLLFQDSRSGSSSAALVGQGRVSALIGAKPAERRQLLEEAAGIIGLHSRRHEAELRLRAAGENLARLEDVITTMEAQLAGLKKQARQAARYRTLSEQIRQLETALLLQRWRAATARQARAQAGLDASEGVVAERTRTAATASTAQAEAAAELPPLRRAEAEAAAALQRLLIAQEGLGAEEARADEAVRATDRQLTQAEGDIERERLLEAEAVAARERLDEEAERLTAARAGEDAARGAAEVACTESQSVVDGLEAALTRTTEAVAAAEADRQALERRTRELDDRVRQLTDRCATLNEQRAALAQAADGEPDHDAAERAVATAERALETVRSELERAEQADQTAQAYLTDRQDALQRAQSQATRLKAEADGIRALADGGGANGSVAALVAAVTVEPGYEAALGAALGEDLAAPADEGAPLHWRSLPPLERVAPLPAGAEPLADRVRAPSVLSRRLAHIGIVRDRAAGRALAPALAPGQQIVTRDGEHWRWDGLCGEGETPTPAAVRLKQINRLKELEHEIGAADAAAHEARADLAAAQQSCAETRAAERSVREAIQAAYGELHRVRDARVRMIEEKAARETRMTAVDAALRDATADRADVEQALAAARQTLTGVPDSAAQRQRLAEQRAATAEARIEQQARRTALEALEREIADRRRRQQAIAEERRIWHGRAESALTRLAELSERVDRIRAERDRLAARPAELAAQREGLRDRIVMAEAARRDAADALARGETAQGEADRASKSAEAALVEAREARVRAAAEVQAAGETVAALTAQFVERLDRRPQDVAGDAPVPDAEADADDTAIDAKLSRLRQQRESLGPVNLRAEGEADELDRRIGAMVGEREDLLAAIGRLRQGIANLNREARQRLIASFDTVDRHFQALFRQLFDGGEAHLRLTDADDPLDAGLDIFASPPGKRLQNLSLLSGGEQALTALALVFAVFLTNPAPICVLDEVDAPLDDANVDRFCALLSGLAEHGTTRFLVITHHRMTMARVDHLYGVTMPERGVSQLVSVDLESAERLAQTA